MDFCECLVDIPKNSVICFHQFFFVMLNLFQHLIQSAFTPSENLKRVQVDVCQFERSREPHRASATLSIRAE